MNVKYLGIISSNKKGNISDVGTYIALRVRVMRLAQHRIIYAPEPVDREVFY